MRSNKYLVSVFLFVLLAGTAQAEPWGPWSTSPDAPASLSLSERGPEVGAQPEQPSDSIAATPFFWLLTFYQKVIGRVNSGRCPMYPTCSRYSVLAIRKHGPVVGIVMTADRLIHELDEQRLAPLVKVGNRYRSLDPVENNDFWWYHE